MRLFAFLWTAPLALAQISVSLTPSVASPAHVGTRVTWTASVSTDSDAYVYRFRTGGFGQDLRVVKDYSPDNTLDWTQANQEGIYQVDVTVRNVQTGQVAHADNWYYVQSNVSGGQPVITPTTHPLVFLYSAPPCPAGSKMNVTFTSADGWTQTTPTKNCTGTFSMNFYLAGLRAGTQYVAQHVITTGSKSTEGPQLTFTSGTDLPANLTFSTAQIPAPGNEPSPVMLQATILTPSIATDLSGNIIWYYTGKISFITRPEPGGYFFGVLEDPAADSSGQIVREFDLQGVPVLETNAARVSQQLVAQGKKPIGSFHHEARLLSNGNVLVLAGEEQILTDVQGPGPVDVLGDAIVVLDRNLNVVWSWDAFDHLDPHRKATENDVCYPGDCPPTYLASAPNDWLHGNSVAETPDGNLLYSSRSQDWVIKIDYERGKGDGSVIWKLGKDGDFAMNSSDPNAWFSHQHDPQYENGSSSVIDLFDNGNLRNAVDPAAHSRGQVLQLDESSRTVTPLLNADLGYYSFALGAAQKLANGNYHFDVGFLSDGSSLSMEVDGAGVPVFSLRTAAPAYRTFRLQDMYTDP